MTTICTSCASPPTGTIASLVDGNVFRGSEVQLYSYIGGYFSVRKLIVLAMTVHIAALLNFRRNESKLCQD